MNEIKTRPLQNASEWLKIDPNQSDYRRTEETLGGIINFDRWLKDEYDVNQYIPNIEDPSSGFLSNLSQSDLGAVYFLIIAVIIITSIIIIKILLKIKRDDLAKRESELFGAEIYKLSCKYKNLNYTARDIEPVLSELSPLLGKAIHSVNSGIFLRMHPREYASVREDLVGYTKQTLHYHNVYKKYKKDIADGVVKSGTNIYDYVRYHFSSVSTYYDLHAYNESKVSPDGVIFNELVYDLVFNGTFSNEDMDTLLAGTRGFQLTTFNKNILALEDFNKAK